MIRSRLAPHLKLEFEDICQETLLKGYQSINDFTWEGGDSFLRWLGGIVEHVVLNLVRRKGREKRVPMDHGPAASEVSPSKGLRRHERFDRLQKAIGDLSDDHRTDVYSLGATIYEMLTWSPPFQGKSYQETLGKIILHDPKPLRSLNPRIPGDLETIILKCLRKDPEDRHATAEALAQDLRRFVRGDPIEARPQPLLEKFGRQVWRNRGRVVAASVFILFLMTASVLYREWQEGYETKLSLYRNQVLGAVVKLEQGKSSYEARR